jgi:hypothetical protein
MRHLPRFFMYLVPLAQPGEFTQYNKNAWDWRRIGDRLPAETTELYLLYSVRTSSGAMRWLPAFPSPGIAAEA